jgi:cupin 2 domain-containing protein
MKLKTGNILENIPAIIPEELFESLIERKSLKIERIVSQGHSTPDGEWYDQHWDEWVLLLQGEAVLRYEDGLTLNLKAGDYINIPANRRHRVDWTQPESNTIWLAIHFEPT